MIISARKQYSSCLLAMKHGFIVMIDIKMPQGDHYELKPTS